MIMRLATQRFQERRLFPPWVLGETGVPRPPPPGWVPDPPERGKPRPRDGRHSGPWWRQYTPRSRIPPRNHLFWGSRDGRLKPDEHHVLHPTRHPGRRVGQPAVARVPAETGPSSFCALTGERSLLQETALRLRGFTAAPVAPDPLLVTSQEYRLAVAKQLAGGGHRAPAHGAGALRPQHGSRADPGLPGPGRGGRGPHPLRHGLRPRHRRCPGFPRGGG